MADKEIIIGLKTTGADQAAAEIKKVDGAIDQAAASMPAMAAGSNKVSASMASMRGGIQNVAFQVQDFAVQVGGGTSAVRALSQQAPQLLSAFGPWGAVAGAAIAIGAPLAASFIGSGKAAEDSAEQVESLADAVQSLNEAQKKTDAGKAADELNKYLDALDDEEQYYDKINRQLERQLGLQTKLRALKEGADAAEREARIAEVEADPYKKPEDKIKEVAAIREEEAAAKAAARKAELQREQDQAAAAAEDASQKAARLADDAAKAKAAREEAERKRAEAVANAQNPDAKIIQDPQYLDIYDRTQKARDQGKTARMEAGRAALAKIRERIRQEILDELPSTEEALNAAKAGEAAKAKAAEAARKEAETAFGKSQVAAAAAREGIPLIDRQADAEKAAREARTNAQLYAANEKERQEKALRDLEKQREQQRGAQSRLDASGREVGDAFGSAAQNMKPGALKDALGDIGRNLSDETSEAEIKKLAAKFEKATEGMNGATVESLERMLTVMLKQAEAVQQTQRKLDEIEAKMKNGRMK